MQLRALSVVVLALAGCGGKYKPDGPVLGDYERSFKYPVHRPHEGLVYSGMEPAISAPVIPLIAFGAAFDLDLAVMPREGDFALLEYARMGLPDRAVWLALETKREGGDQTVLANVDDIESLMPEIPIYRQSVNLQANDRSTEFTVDVALTYQNSRGESVSATFTGDPPIKPAKKRNAKTWDYAENQALAVVDIPSSESLFKASVEIDGKSIGFKKMGLVPSQYALQQVQGGIATGAFRVIPEAPASGGLDYGMVFVSTPGGSQPEVVVQEPSIAVRMAIVQNLSAIEKCYELRLRDNPAIAGSMWFDWQIEAGVVTGAKMMDNPAPDAVTDQALGDCIVASIQAWTLDPTVSGTVAWPFDFAPGDELTEPTVTLGEGTITLAAEAAPSETLGDEDLMAPAEGDALADEDPSMDGAPAAMAPALMSSFKTVHTMPSGNSVELKWLVTQQGDRVTARQSTELRQLVYNYRLVQNSYLELVSITVEQYGRATPVTAITFNPPLPDIRWPFNGRRVSTFVIDVNGQQNYAFGDVESYWTESGPKVKVAPAAPEWAVSRPLLSSINFIDGAALVKTERTGE
jgi:hypothetical protein